MIEVSSKIDYANPFPGLRSFEREDSHLFFGRDQHIKELRELLPVARLLAIVGYSGSGKSSLIKAGLLPALQRERAGWLVLPLTLGSNPFQSLADAIQKFFTDQNTNVSHLDIEQMLRDEPQALVDLFVGQQEQVLLFIDQFEEIFQLRLDENEDVHEQDDTALFVNLLLTAAKKSNNPVYIVLTMRSDFLDYCTLYEGLTEAINKGSYLLPKMNSAEIRDVITKPVKALGAQITSALTEQLLKDTGRNAHQLPVLQHALMRTWDYWQQNASPEQPIDRIHYEAIGTMSKAIALHAEELYAQLPSDKLRLATEKIFKSLIALGPDDQSIINPISVSTIKSITGLPEYQLFDTIDRFRARDVSFLLPFAGHSVGQDTIISISRGRIVQLWGRLREWAQEETESAKLYKELAKSAEQYQEGKTGLLTPPELQIALKWQKDNKPTLAWAQRYDAFLERAINYLDYSKDQYDFEVHVREQRQKQDVQRNRTLAVVGITLAVAAIITAIYFTLLAGEAKQARKEAENNAKNARREQLNAEEQTREAISQSKIAQQLQEIAEQQRLLTEEQRTIAEEQRQKAQEQQDVAVKQRIRADQERSIAVEQKNLANAATRLASVAEKRAKSASKISDSLKVLAEQTSEKEKLNAKEASRQGMLAIAQSMAIKSLQTVGGAKDSLPKLLAVLAYQLNIKNGGQLNSPAIFSALSKEGNRKTIFEGHRDNIRSLTLLPGDNLLASSGDDGTVRIWRLGSNQPATVFTANRKASGGFRSVAFSNDGRQVFAGNVDGQLYSWSISKPKNGTFHATRSSSIFALLPYKKGSELVSASTDGVVRFWKITPDGLDTLGRIATGQRLFTAQLSPSGNQLVCGSDNGHFVFVDLLHPAEPAVVVNRPELRGARITALAFSPDGKHLLTGNAYGAVHLWNVANGKITSLQALLPNGHTTNVTDAIIAPNDYQLITGSLDGSVRIWSMKDTKLPPIVINDYRNWIMSLLLSPDGNTLFYAGADKTIRSMNININELYQRVAKAAKGNRSDAEWTKLMDVYLAQPGILLETN